MAAALIPAAGLVSGTLEDSVTVTINKNSISEKLRSVFESAQTLAIVASSRADIRAADVLETKGGYTVTIDRPTAKTGEMTSSERREALRRLCSARPQPDIALIGRTEKSDSSITLVAGVTGRMKVMENWPTEVLACRTSRSFSFNGTTELNAGIYNVKESEIEEIMGAEAGAKMIEAFARARPVDERSSASGKNPTQDSVPSTPTPGKAPPAQAAPSKVPSNIAFDVQRGLAELGYLKAKPDGVFGKTTSDALKKFQNDNGLTVTGMPDKETLAALTQLTTSKTAR